MSEPKTWKCHVLPHCVPSQECRSLLESEDTIYFRFDQHTPDGRTCQYQQENHEHRPEPAGSHPPGLAAEHPLVWIVLVPLFLCLARTVINIIMVVWPVLLILLGVMLNSWSLVTADPDKWHSGLAEEYRNKSFTSAGRRYTLEELGRMDHGHLIIHLKKYPASFERNTKPTESIWKQHLQNQALREALRKRIDSVVRGYVDNATAAVLGARSVVPHLSRAGVREQDRVHGQDNSEYLTYFVCPTGSVQEPHDRCQFFDLVGESGHDSQDETDDISKEKIGQEDGNWKAQTVSEDNKESRLAEDEEWQEVAADEHEAHGGNQPSENTLLGWVRRFRVRR